jgi:flagellar biosynthesis/type III secretory pathway M-ring protein FliF/YscJ
MDFLQRILTQVRAHLDSLGQTQRFAIVLSAVLVAVATGWLLNWAGSREAIPLLNQDFTDEELAEIQTHLDDMGVDYHVVGSRVMVEATRDERRTLQAKMMQRGAFPEDTSVGFLEMLTESSPLISNEQNRQRFNFALQNELGRTFGRMSGVERCTVFISGEMKRRVGGPSIMPTATVQVWMSGKQAVDKNLAYAIARGTAGSVSGLDPWRVAVTDMGNNQDIRIPNPSEGIALDILEKRQSNDKYLEDKIRAQFMNIPGIRVQVFSELVTDRMTEHTTIGGQYTKNAKDKTKTQESRTPGQEPGVSTNVGGSAVAMGRTDRLQEEESSTEKVGVPDHSTKTVETSPGVFKSARAAVYVPRGYLVDVLKKNTNPPPQDSPTDEDLIPVQTTIFEDIRSQVANIINAEDPEKQVAVSMSYEIEDAMAANTSGDDGDSMVTLAKRYGAKGGLGALALLSLGMMLMMVRRASEGPEIPIELTAAPEKELAAMYEQVTASPIGTLPIDGGPIGEAGASAGMLVGQELDAETLKTHQLVDQVTEAAADSPELCARLLTQWIES